MAVEHADETLARASSGLPADPTRKGRRSAYEAPGDATGPGREQGLLRLDPDGRVTSWNREAERILGVGPGKLLGQSCPSLLAENDVEMVRWTRALEVADSRGIYDAYGWKTREDGSRFWASVTLRAARDQTSGQPGFVAVVRDVSEEECRAEQLRGALEISRAVLAGEPADAVLQLVASRSRTLVDGDCALVRTLGASGDVLILRATAWRHPSDALLAAPAGEVLRFGSITGQVFDSGHPRLVAGRARTVRTQSRSEVLRPVWPSVGPALYVPLSAEGQKFGTLVVLNWKTGRPFRRPDLDLLQILARQTALAFQNACVNRERERLAVAQERERLGRELHDGAIQSLYAITLFLAGTIARTADQAVEEHLAGVSDRIDAVIGRLRAHIQQLRGDSNRSRRTKRQSEAQPAVVPNCSMHV